MTNLEIIVPTADSSFVMGEANGVPGAKMKTKGTIMLDCANNLGLQSAGNMNIQSNSAAQFVADSGITVGSPATICVTAGGHAQIYAGAGQSAGKCGEGELAAPGEPAAAPTASGGPNPDSIRNDVLQANGPNTMIKGVADMAQTARAVNDIRNDGFGSLREGSGFQQFNNVRGFVGDMAGGAKGALDFAQGVAETAGYGQEFGNATQGTLFERAGSALDAIGGATGLNPTGAIQNTAATFAEGEGGTAGDNQASSDTSASATGGGVDVDIRAPNDILGQAGNNFDMKVDTDSKISAGSNISEVAGANIEMTAKAAISGMANKIEWTAATGFAVKAGSKVETCSMVFEVHASAGVSIRGCAAVGIIGGINTTVEGVGSCDGKSMAKVEVSAPTVNIRGSAVTSIIGAKAVIDTPNTFIEGQLFVAGQSQFKDAMICNSKLTCDETVEIGGAIKHANLKVS